MKNNKGKLEQKNSSQTRVRAVSLLFCLVLEQWDFVGCFPSSFQINQEKKYLGLLSRCTDVYFVFLAWLHGLCCCDNLTCVTVLNGLLSGSVLLCGVCLFSWCSLHSPCYSMCAPECNFK